MGRTRSPGTEGTPPPRAGGRWTARLRAHARRALAFVRHRVPGGPAHQLAYRLAALAGSLVLAFLYPTLTLIAAVVWLWILWPLALRRRAPDAVGPGRGEPARVHDLPLRYHGGHPGLPRPGQGTLRVWPDDGAAELRVGRASVAFPLTTVQSVTLVEGRVLLRTGCRGWLAEAVGRVLAPGVGRYCGLQRHRDEDLAVVDRSRVLCDVHRLGRPCRMVLTGRRGGGEEVYLETLVMLRPLASWREPGAAGGSRGAAASPPPGLG